MIDYETIFTLYYTIPIVLIQLLACILLWRQTKDTRTWSLFVIGSLLSVAARAIIWADSFVVPAWIPDAIRASSITVNAGGLYSLYFLLKKLIQSNKVNQ